MFKKMYFVLLLVLTLAVPMLVSAQDEYEFSFSDPVFLWSAGQLDATDMNVYYSLFVMSGEEPVSDLIINATVPEGATFVDAFWTPETSTFVGEAEGQVAWELPALGPETVMGPFTFRVTFEGSDAEDFAPVGAVEGNVTLGDVIVNSQAFGDEVLSVVEDTGTITIEPSGTVDLVPVGDSGAWLYVPADSVSETVTLTLTRLPITEDAVLPEVDFEIWWCGQYSISADKDVTFNQPIMFILPIRRALTPNMDVAVFAPTEVSNEWTILSDGIEETTDGETARALVSRDGLVVEFYLESASFSTTPEVFAIGTSSKKRTASVAGPVGRPDDAEWF